MNRWVLFLVLAVPWLAAEDVSPPTKLPAYSVVPEFTLLIHLPPNDRDFRFVSVDEGSPYQDERFVRFRSTTVRSGDQIVSVAGKSVADMEHRQTNRLLLLAKPNAKIEVEVRAPDSKAVRKATVTRVVRPVELSKTNDGRAK